MKKILLMIALLLILTVTVTACGGKAAATVNGQKITEDELNIRLDQVAAMYGYDLTSTEGKEIVDYLREQILESLIEEKVILQAAEEKKITVAKDELDKEFKSIRDQFSDDKQYKGFLEERKFTEKDLKIYIEHQIILNKLFDEMTKDITSTSEDVEKYYQDNKEEFFEPEQLRARNIVVKTEEEAKAIIERLNKGEDFAQLAVQLSIDPTAKENQGDIGFFDKDASLVEEFKDAAFQLEVGEYTKVPVQSVFGYHIIKIEDRIEDHQRTFDEVKEDLEERFVMEEKNQKFSIYVDELREKAKIEKLLPESKPEENEPEENTPEENTPEENTPEENTPEESNQGK